MSALLDFDAGGFDLSANAAAPLADWATALQARAHYAPFGRGPEAFDCFGIVYHVAALIGRPVRDYLDCMAGVAVDDVDAVDQIMRAEQGAWRRAEGQVGDVLVLGHARRAHHVAVLCGASHALHARPATGVAIKPIVGRRRVRNFEGMRLYGVVAPA